MNKKDSMQYINTQVWSYFKTFLENSDCKQFQTSCQSLVQEIYKTGDSTMLNFCENIIICYVPIINSVKEWE